MYTHVTPGNPEKAADQAKNIVLQGFDTMKTDPFMPEMAKHHRRYLQGTISPKGADLAVNTIAAIREAVGNNVDILIDCHGNFNVPTAIAMAKLLEPYNIGWFEEPVAYWNTQGLAEVSQRSPVRIATGENLIGLRMSNNTNDNGKDLLIEKLEIHINYK